MDYKQYSPAAGDEFVVHLMNGDVVTLKTSSYLEAMFVAEVLGFLGERGNIRETLQWTDGDQQRLIWRHAIAPSFGSPAFT